MISRMLSVAACLATVYATAATAQQRPVSARVTDIHYRVRFDTVLAARGQLAVTTSFRTAGVDPVLLSMPIWTPGAYEVSNFARNVVGFTATTDGRPLKWDKLDHDTWRVFPLGAQTVEVRFHYVADSLDNAMAWTQPDFALFNGTNVFMYPEGLGLDFPARVTIQTEPGWKVATGMAGGRGEYHASNFHDLVDMPVFVGRIDVDSMQIAGTWNRLATYPAGAMEGEGRRTLWQQIEQITPPMTAVFGETPWDSYTTLLIFTPEYGGGSALEHQNSHVGIYNPGFIGNPLLASITAHEIFHAWNVKRLRPAEMVPYDYSRPQPTTLLWMSEGITDYYADLALVRGNVIPPEIFYRLTAGKIDEVANTDPVALEDASLSTWIDPVDGSRYIYYPKGSLVGFLLDIMIRDGSNNRASLDHVLRTLYQATFKAGRGFTDQEFWAAVEQAAGGRSFADVRERYVDGRDELPWARMLPLAGLVFVVDSARVPRMGVTTVQDSAGIRVNEVQEGSAAADAGVHAGDYLLRVGEVDVRDPTFGQQFRARYGNAAAGTPIRIVVRRGDREVELTGALRFDPVVSYNVREDSRASEKARRIREGILRGTTG